MADNPCHKFLKRLDYYSYGYCVDAVDIIGIVKLLLDYEHYHLFSNFIHEKVSPDEGKKRAKILFDWERGALRENINDEIDNEKKKGVPLSETAIALIRMHNDSHLGLYGLGFANSIIGEFVKEVGNHGQIDRKRMSQVSHGAFMLWVDLQQKTMGYSKEELDAVVRVFVGLDQPDLTPRPDDSEEDEFPEPKGV